jgi:hypothetical protein
MLQISVVTVIIRLYNYNEKKYHHWTAGAPRERAGSEKQQEVYDMMKRVLSFLLCLIMVVGLAAPSVQASSIDNSSTSSVLDGVYISGDTNGTVIVDGEDVTEEVKDNTLDNLPSFGGMTTPTTAPSTPVEVDLCKCVDLSTAKDHPGVCKVKAPYIELCNTASEPELYEKWTHNGEPMEKCKTCPLLPECTAFHLCPARTKDCKKERFNIFDRKLKASYGALKAGEE